MARIKKSQKDFIKEETDLFFHQLLSFHVSYQAANMLITDAVEDWRSFEDRLYLNYPVKGIGIKATRKNLDEPDFTWNGFIHNEEPLSPSEVTPELYCFPLQAASAAYVYTLLEGFGNKISKELNPGALKDRQAWHHGVYGDLNLSDKAAIAKAKKSYAKSFSVSDRKITKKAISRLALLKKARNEFMHDGDPSVDFNQFFQCSVQTACHIFFMLIPSESKISAYPFHDLNGKWPNN